MFRSLALVSSAVVAIFGQLAGISPCCAQDLHIAPAIQSPADSVNAPDRLPPVAPPVNLELTYSQRQELANAAAALESAAQLMLRGGDRKAIELANRGFQIRQRILGLEHKETILAMALLGSIYGRDGALSESRAMFQLAYDNSVKTVGLENHLTATCMSKLAEAYETFGKVEEAERLFRESLRIKEKLLGPEHWETVYAMYSLGSCLSAQFRPDGNDSTEEAKDLLFRSLEIAQRTQSPLPDVIGKIQSGIAMAYQTNQEFDKAEPFLRSIVESLRNSPNGIDPELSTSLNNLGACLYYQKKLGEAETAYQEALTISEEKFGLDHHNTAGCLNNLAVLRFAQKRYSEAVPLFERQHAIFRKLLGPDHLKVKESQKNLDNAIEKLEQSK